ncbi:kinase-like domain-containing protein, partial [Choanephora cucurbitarum]
EECWKSILTLDKSKFMKGWKPSSDQYESLYDQLFDYYFHRYSSEIRQFVEHNPYLTWFIPKCFEQSQPLPSGPTRRKGQANYSFALVYLAAEFSLEQCIPQVDQWSFQKIYRTALSIASGIRDSDKVHPNLQPKNILLFPRQQQWSFVDDWSIATNISPFYGRYPYLPPEGTLTKASNIYSLGVILWQLASGLVFPQFSPVSPAVYHMLPVTSTIHPAYQELVVGCLSKYPQQRPSADYVCNILLNLLMSEMSCPVYSKQAHVQSVRDRQWSAAQYLASCSSSVDIQALLIGASITKRMVIQMAISFRRHRPTPPSATGLRDTEGLYVQKKRKSYLHQESYSRHYGYSNDLNDLMQMGSVA